MFNHSALHFRELFMYRPVGTFFHISNPEVVTDTKTAFLDFSVDENTR